MSTQEDYIWKEDQWFCVIRQSHHLFCDCGSWIQHLNKVLIEKEGPQWLELTGQEKTDGDGAEEENGAPTDAEIIQLLEDIGGGDGEDTDKK